MTIDLNCKDPLGKLDLDPPSLLQQLSEQLQVEEEWLLLWIQCSHYASSAMEVGVLTASVIWLSWFASNFEVVFVVCFLNWFPCIAMWLGELVHVLLKYVMRLVKDDKLQTFTWHPRKIKPIEQFHTNRFGDDFRRLILLGGTCLFTSPFREEKGGNLASQNSIKNCLVWNPCEVVESGELHKFYCSF